MAVVEHGAEQWQWRSHTAATLGQRQGRVLVGQQCAEALVHGLRALAHAHLVKVDAQRQGIDEHAQRPLGAFATL
ncbi:hypothetical protein D3C76_246860 [compost metagenome]